MQKKLSQAKKKINKKIIKYLNMNNRTSPKTKIMNKNRFSQKKKVKIND